MNTPLIHSFGEARASKDKARSVDVIASTAAIDGHGTIVEQDWQLSRYSRNPVVLFEHGRAVGDGFFTAGGERPHDKIPIARAENVRVEGGKLRAQIVFPASGRDELADRVFAAVEDGRLNGVSVGFVPGEVRAEKRGGRDVRVLASCELFEISVCGIPSNAEAVVQRSLATFLAAPAPATDDFDGRVAAYRHRHPGMLESVAIGAVLRNKDLEPPSADPDVAAYMRKMEALGTPVTELEAVNALLRPSSVEPPPEAA